MHEMHEKHIFCQKEAQKELKRRGPTGVILYLTAEDDSFFWAV